MKDIQIEGFKKTLNPVTVEYLEEKLEKTSRVDLRKITEKAANELQKLENEAAYDYLKIEKETKVLISEIQQSDTILEKLENLLNDFRDNLSVIKGEMTNLQNKSMKMNIGLNNRRNLSHEFSEFIESIMLEPKLIEDILKGEINEEYVSNITKLLKKLNNLKRYNSLDNKSVKEIEPELTKLKMKACDRIKAYMNQQISNLKKPKTNIQIIQQNNLINYRIFLYFLKEHSQDTYIELTQNYSKLLSKVYYNNFKTYIDDLSKLLENGYNQEYNIFPESQLVFKMQNFPNYDITKRIKIMESLDEQLIIAHYESRNNKKFYLEQIFQSLNKLLVATIIQEYTFCQNFFCLTDEESLVFFATIFKHSCIFVMEKMKQWIVNANDIYGVLLISCILLKTKENLHKRNFIALDLYFTQIESILWPKLNTLFDNLMKNLNKVNPRILKQILVGVGEDLFFLRSVNYIDGIASINQFFDSKSFNLKKRLSDFMAHLTVMIDKISKEALMEKEIITLSINSLHAMVKGLKNSDHMSQEVIYNVETKLNDMIEKIVEKLFEEYFKKIFFFLKKKKNEDTNLRQVEETNQDFYQNWNLKLANMKNEIESKFKKYEISSKIMKKVVHKLLEIYEEFYVFVKEVYPSYTSNLYPVHKLNVEIKKIVKN